MNILSNSNYYFFNKWFDAISDEGGIILINKPIGYTSFDIIKQLKKHFKGYKIGHSGTLDPLASGLMLVAIGKATKLLTHFTDFSKEYCGIIKLGVTTASLDKETPEIGYGNLQNISEAQIYEVAKSFVGKLKQTPPVYSAVKIDGQSSYKYIRSQSNDSELQTKQPLPREVEIKSLIIKEIDLPFVHFQIYVSKGFYVRQFAQDFAKQLGTIGYLYGLERTKINDYEIKDAIKLENLLKLLENN